MARLSGHNGVAKPFTAWTTVFYLLLVFIAPLAFFGTAHAEDDSALEYGTGRHSIRRSVGREEELMDVLFSRRY